MERSRRERFRSQPIPLTWELPVVAVATTLLMTVLTVLTTQGLISAVVTGRFAWPVGDLLGALAGLARGEFGGGLPPQIAAQLPPDAVMWTITAAAELMMLASLLILGQWMREAAGMGSPRGLASTTQAAEALGVKQLRAKAGIVRPDLQPHTLWRVRR